jgi:cell division protein FtsL
MAPAIATERSLRAAPAPEVDARPDLRVVEPVDESPARRSFGGMVGTIAVVLLFACIFGVVVFQVLLVQTQSHLDDLDGALAAQEARANELDLRTADLESPQRIVTAAQGLGMITPDHREYLEWSEGDDVGAVYDPATEPVGTVPTTVAGAAATTTDTSSTAGTTPATTSGTTTGATTPSSGAVLPPGPPYTAENNWGAGGPPTTPPVYSAENNWGAGPTTTPTGGR